MKKSALQNETITSASQEKISQRARELWEGYGRPAGRDKEIWLEAESQLLGVDPLVEGMGDISVSAPAVDEATRQKKPITRLKKTEPAPPVQSPAARSAPVLKSATPAKSAKPTKSSKLATPAVPTRSKR